jgi:DNA-binding transcriptional ArsR family regulator
MNPSLTKQLDALHALGLNQPTRLRIALHLLEHREASPNAIRKALGDDGATLGAVAYHCRALRDAGIVRLAREGRVRGAVEHHYTLTADARKRVKRLAATPTAVAA